VYKKRQHRNSTGAAFFMAVRLMLSASSALAYSGAASGNPVQQFIQCRLGFARFIVVNHGDNNPR
jgi:hypothetical protein